jgi:hypothetical protein
MMYNQKLAAAIKVNGKVLREFKDTVYIPFGSEYAITLKNLHTTRAVVNVYIDGDNMVPGGLVLNAGQSVDLERSIKNGNLTEGNRFKFIERSGAVEQHRGIKLEDGLVRIEYQFEQARPVINVAPVWTTTQPQWMNTPYYGVTGSTGSFNVNGVLRNVDTSKGETVRAMAAAATNATLSTMNIKASSADVHDGMATMDSFVNDVGITVPGSRSTQTFQSTTVGLLESAVHNIVLKLVGDLGDNKPVGKAVTVKHKPKCITCGKQNKHTAKFCTECGTALEVFA